MDKDPPLANGHSDAAMPDETGAQAPVGQAAKQACPDEGDSRRQFLHRSMRKLAYAAPVVLLFHPKRACASNGSTLTLPG